MIGLLVGGVVLLLLLLAGGAIVAKTIIDDITVVTRPNTTLRPRSSTTSRFPTTTRERSTTTPTAPTTSVAGTGAPTMLTTVEVAGLLQDQLRAANPDLSIGTGLCPRSPYRVGHVMDCRVRVQDAFVVYRVEVTGDRTIKADPTKPVVDTDKAEAVMEVTEPGGRATCGTPRIRQLDIGARLTCRTTTTTWDFTVTPTGELSGAPR